jgi:hypothetical protein
MCPTDSEHPQAFFLATDLLLSREVANDKIRGALASTLSTWYKHIHRSQKLCTFNK